MDTHAPPQADADYLTAALRKSGALSGNGRVVAAAVVHTFPTILSRFHRLKLAYEGAADAPRLLYLKTGLPDGPGAAWTVAVARLHSTTPSLQRRCRICCRAASRRRSRRTALGICCSRISPTRMA